MVSYRYTILNPTDKWKISETKSDCDLMNLRYKNYIKFTACNLDCYSTDKHESNKNYYFRKVGKLSHVYIHEKMKWNRKPTEHKKKIIFLFLLED